MMRSAGSIEPSIETSGGASTVVARDETERLRTRTRWGYGGLAIGIGLGFALTAVQVASAGYAILPFQFVWNLIWAPFLGVVIGRALSRTQPIEPSVETPGEASTVVARDETERLRTRTRWGYGGFAIGLGLGLALTAAQVASAGYFIIPFQFGWNLIWAPFLGVVIGRALSRTQPIEPSVETSRSSHRPSSRRTKGNCSVNALAGATAVLRSALGRASPTRWQKSRLPATLSCCFISPGT